MAHHYLSDASKARFKQAVESVEQQSAAEIVVAIRPRSGIYRDVDYLIGALMSGLGLAILLFVDYTFSHLEAALLPLTLFAAGVFFIRLAIPLRLKFVGAARIDDNVETSARACFQRQGVDRTRDRSGVLVFVSLHERRAKVVPDVGVLAAMTEEGWAPLAEAIEESVAQHIVTQAGPQRLAEAIEALAAPLGEAMPRRADDTNELPDVMEEEA